MAASAIRLPGFEIRSTLAQYQHLRTDMQAMLTKIRRSTSMQGINSFDHFQGIADRVTKRLVHIRKQGHHLPPGQIADIDHQAGKLTGFIQVFHERTQANLYIQQDGLRPGSNFLAHNG